MLQLWPFNVHQQLGENMNKKDLKKLCLLGLTCGASLAAQGSANASEGVMLAGGCGGFSSRGNPQVSDNYIPSGGASYYAPSHGCSSQGPSAGYYAPAPQAGCNGQYSAGGYQGGYPQGGYVQGGYTQGGYTQGGYTQDSYQPTDNRQLQGGFYSQDTANRNMNHQFQNQQWGQNAPNAGSSKNFPSTMNPAQNTSNPINNQNLQNPNTVK